MGVAFDAGASEVLLSDSHGDAQNIAHFDVPAWAVDVPQERNFYDNLRFCR